MVGTPEVPLVASAGDVAREPGRILIYAVLVLLTLLIGFRFIKR